MSDVGLANKFHFFLFHKFWVCNKLKLNNVLFEVCVTNETEKAGFMFLENFNKMLISCFQ